MKLPPPLFFIKMKRVFLIHGWEGYPDNCWFPWLKAELKEKGFEVIIPAMPSPDNPKIGEWVNFLKEQVVKPDENTYFIGHSMGCRTILQYLQDLPEKSKVGGVIFVAGWISLTPMATRTEQEKQIAKPWLEKPHDYKKMKAHCDKFVAIFSDNDLYVPIKENSDTYKEKLNAKIIVEKGKGHFGDDDNVKELPIVLKELLKMVKAEK